MTAVDLAAALDALPIASVRYQTCETLNALSSADLDAIRRNLARGVKPTPMAKKLRSLGFRVSEERFREHAEGVCPQCKISLKL